MKLTIRKTAAVAALVAASALALPTAAQAAIYPPSNACSVVPTVVTPGATVTFSCTDGTFTPSEFVSVRVTGNTSATVGYLKFATTSTGSATSTDAGALSLPIAFPSNASGTYNIEAFSETSAGGSSSVTISTSTSGGSDGDLAVTGVDSASLLGVWVGGGALVLVGGALAVAAAVRHNRKQSAGI